MFSEDPILLPEIVDQIVLVTVHPASEREDEELQRRRHSLRLLGRLDQHRPSLGRLFAPYAVGRLNAPYAVEVFSPRVPEPKKFTWSKSLRVGDAADQAAKAFDYEAGTPTFQNKDGKVLDRDKTLIEANVRDFDQLELTDKGGGV